MILAWLLLLTGLTISAVAIYYSVVGLTAIFSAAVIPIIIMGSALEVGKLVCASWLKANWERAPRFMKYYMITAVMVLMLITSMGIFGFLSKAHNDQNLVSGDVQSKIAIYDEKIKTEKENIEANRKALKQMDEGVDQVLGRSADEKGADKAVALRRSQQKERGRLQAEISQSQKSIAELNDARAPIAAEVRKVEAEVGPIKYIAKFIYGDDGANENMLERAVTWIIVLIVIVFDPLAVIMLLAAQMTFGWLREQRTQDEDTPDPYIADVGEKPTKEELDALLVEEANAKIAEIEKPVDETWPFPTYEEITPKPEEPKPHHPDTHPYLRQGFNYPENYEHVAPMVAKSETVPVITVDSTEHEASESKFKILPELEEESKKKISYMIKDQGQQVVKTREDISKIKSNPQEPSGNE